ncbi:MAG: carboxymuconolactone decarboxylase family protein [Phormidesmis sp.]
MNTLAQQLSPASVDFFELHQNYSPMLNLVKELIGVIPNCDPILEIWPVGFRTYNLIVPNFLNLPLSLFGGKPDKALLGLAMYVASDTAQCAYCTAHCCSFALRRGLSPTALNTDDNSHSPKEKSLKEKGSKEKAVIDLAKGLSSIPANVPIHVIATLKQHFSTAQMEQLALAVAMMGFLNKFMDALGTELEASAISDVSRLLTPLGWSPGKHATAEQLSSVSPQSVSPQSIEQDSFRTYLRVLRQAPSALLLERQWTKVIPGDRVRSQTYLQGTIGYHFPLVKQIGPSRVIRALTTILRDNCDRKNTVIGIEVKALCGLVFASVVDNKHLQEEAIALTKLFNPDLSEKTLQTAIQLATWPVPTQENQCQQQLAHLMEVTGGSQQLAAALILTRAMAHSPSKIAGAILTDISPLLSPKAIVELTVWISIQQLMHRLERYYAALTKDGNLRP